MKDASDARAIATMTQLNGHGGTIVGTFSGTLLTVFANIHSEDLVKTTVLAILGAVVSFGVSVGLKWMVRKLRRG